MHMQGVPRKAVKLRRFDTIDLLRGLSVLAVILSHSYALMIAWSKGGPWTVRALPDFGIAPNVPAWLHWGIFFQGSRGVSVFFAVSGFLITYTALERFGGLDRLRLGAFYRIRFARIGPALFLLLAILSAVHFLHVDLYDIPNGTWASTLFAALTFRINWYEAVHGMLNSPWSILWSLSVEEVFYLVYPLLCVLLLRRRATRPIFFLVLCAVQVIGPFARMSRFTPNLIWQMKSYLGNMDNIAMGCLFGLLTKKLEQYEGAVRSWIATGCKAVGAVVLALAWFPYAPLQLHFAWWQVSGVLIANHVDVNQFGLGACLVMLGSVLRPRGGSVLTLPIRRMGQLSYEIYLFHMLVVLPVIPVFLRMGGRYPCLWIVGLIVASTLLGYAVSHYVSEPLNARLRGAPLPIALPAGVDGEPETGTREAILQHMAPVQQGSYAKLPRALAVFRDHHTHSA